MSCFNCTFWCLIICIQQCYSNDEKSLLLCILHRHCKLKTLVNYKNPHCYGVRQEGHLAIKHSIHKLTNFGRNHPTRALLLSVETRTLNG